MNKGRDNQGMTLVELLLAMAILAVLLGAAARVLRALHTSSQIITTEGLQEDQRAGLRNLLLLDCVHATSLESFTTLKSFTKSADGLTITSQAYLDETTHQVKHLPATITYEIRSINGSSWLIRTQRKLESQKPFVELVCDGVSGMEVEMICTAEPESSASATTQATTSTAEEDSPPITMNSNEAVITVHFADGSEDLALYCFTP